MRTSSLWWSCEKLGLSSIEWTGREELSGIGDKRKLLRLFSVTSALENRTTRHECFPCSAKQSTEHNLGIKRLSRPEKETEILTEEIPLAVCRRIRAAPYPGNVSPGSSLCGIWTRGRDHEYLWTRVSVILCSADCIRSKSHWYTLVSMRKGEPLL